MERIDAPTYVSWRNWKKMQTGKFPKSRTNRKNQEFPINLLEFRQIKAKCDRCVGSKYCKKHMQLAKRLADLYNHKV